MHSPYLLLLGAIVAEIVGTVALKYSDGMTRLAPALLVVIAYAVTFWLAALALKVMPLGVTAALWAGLGIVGLTLLGVLLFGERFGWIEMAGIAMILSGTLLLTLFSKAATRV